MIYLYIKRLNLTLTVFLFLIGIYILFVGLIPEINLQIVKASDKTHGFVYKSNLVSKEGINDTSLKEIPNENRLVIPKIFVNGIINEGENKETLDLGLWRRPNTATPEIGSNTVVTAHRFLYKHGPNTFYHLDKLAIGDKMLIFWNKKEYDYEIFEIKEVFPTEISVENSTSESILTLYTCTPLYSSQKRLVIKAKVI